MGGYPSLIPMQSAEYSEYLYNATKKCLLFSVSCDTLCWHAQGMPPVGSHLLVSFREEIRAPRGDKCKFHASEQARPEIYQWVSGQFHAFCFCCLDGIIESSELLGKVTQRIL